MTKLKTAAAALLLSTSVAYAHDSAVPDRLEINMQALVVARSELYIDAPPAAVWAVLTDFAGWTEYMPEFASARLDGPLAAGSVLHWEPQGQTVESQLVAVETDRRLVWNGTDGAVHVWELVPSGAGTLLRNDESIDDWQLVASPEEGTVFLTQSLTVWNERIAEQVALRAK